MRSLFLASIVALGLVSISFGQSAISAKAGLVHYAEGKVLLDGKEIETKAGGKFPEMKEGGTLTTEEGRVEILLNPGVYLRLAENSSVKMITNRLIDTRLDVLSGTALVEVTEVLADNHVTVLCKEATVEFTKSSLVRFDAEHGVSVFKGQADFVAGGKTQTLREGKEMLFDGNLTVAKFDNKAGDPLYRWASRRSEYLSLANMASANQVRHSGYTSGFTQSGWFFNPVFGMFTYLPISGYYTSPFGYGFYSPVTIYRVINAYNPAPIFGGGSSLGQGASGPRFDTGLGYNTNSRAGIATSTPSVSAPAAPAAGGRGDMGGGAATGRGGSSGRGR
jgi:hypothetical protein